MKELAPKVRAVDVMPDVLGTAQIAAGGVGTEELADGAVTSGKVASGQIGSYHIYDYAITSGKIASGQVGSTHMCAKMGLASGAGTSFVFYHNLGVVPDIENIHLVPRGNATFWVDSVDASSVTISTSVSGVGCNVKVCL